MIYLTYRGVIPSKSSNNEAVWAMRQAFHEQLSKLWGKEPYSVLKDWEDSNFAAGAPDFRKRLGNQVFIPFFGKKVGFGVELDLELLVGSSPFAAVINEGDLDNRAKRIVDALQCPTQPTELSANYQDPRYYCLMDNDSSVTALSVRLGPYLDSNAPEESFAFIRVKPSMKRTSLDTLAMAF